ncbi:nucleoid-associated protein [Martelella mediterranea]|uniref:nucleoid-associated protein n=1 Tax=Martelella mediterranea TaxID=293089 RepID=UPI001E561B75|nr:nucleoid-associated protein [Martelella mediterranea]MCD1634454.1 nucleoid-associated protein [Martelella mediterranea]
MADNIISVAIHHLEKVDAGEYQVHAGNGALAVGNTAKRLIDDLHRLYARRPSKAYGRFSTDTDNFPSSLRLREYIIGTATFEETTLALMDTLSKEASARPASEGGHVFFAHFAREEIQYILVAIVNDKISAALTENTDLEDVKHLDVDGYRFAGRVNLHGWDNDQERYVSFLKGKGAVSEYFKAFLGCDTTVLARVETTNMVEALKDFAEKQNMNPAERTSFLDRAVDILSRDVKLDKPVDFAALANELLPDDPEPLIEVLADPDRSLNDGFVADRRALKGLVEFKQKTSNWTVEFARKALHEEKVRFDPVENSLTLLDVPENMRQELIKEIEGD